MSLAPASHQFWGVGAGLERGEHYLERKRQMRDRLVRSAERAIPGFADAIVYEESATPITLERYMRSTGGTSYGIAGTPAQMGLGRPGPRTPIDGLFLAGASTRSVHGVTHAMLGGAEAASAILGMPTENVLRGARSTRTTVAAPPARERVTN
jgi:phytoene dehydrogenase-like protein